MVQESQTVNVTLGLTLQSILDVDMDKGTLTSLVWLNIQWTDPFLAWDTDLQHFMIKDIRLPVSHIWSPHLEIYNGISQKLTTRTDMAVIYNG